MSYECPDFLKHVLLALARQETKQELLLCPDYTLIFLILWWGIHVLIAYFSTSYHPPENSNLYFLDKQYKEVKNRPQVLYLIPRNGYHGSNNTQVLRLKYSSLKGWLNWMEFLPCLQRTLILLGRTMCSNQNSWVNLPFLKILLSNVSFYTSIFTKKKSNIS